MTSRRGLLPWILVAGCGGDPSTTDATSAGTGDTGGSSDTGDTGESWAPATAGSPPTTGDATTTPGETTATSITSSEATSDTTSETTGSVDGGLTRRPAAPIVLIGGQVPGLADVAAGDIVGFAWRDGWEQVAIQVDERVLGDFCDVYAAEILGDGAPCNTSKTIKALFYADPGTWTGADTDPLFDLDDELVFMARDAGGRVTPGSEPAGVVAGSGVEVEVVDGDETGWVYLYARSDAGLDPGAGADLVAYVPVFDPAIDYKTEYPFVGDGSCGDAVCDPPILEDSVVTTPHYERHFSARWVTDSLRITTEGSSGEDLLDIAQARFAPSVCGRHVLTFSTAEGAFITNIDGPVRAIRSYIGANSGPLTQRTHLFYDRVEVVQTFLRVHPIPAIMELVDHAADAAGMTYYNEHNLEGVAIDGMPDPGVDKTTFAWDVVTGPHGAVVNVIDSKFSQNLTTQAYYEDDADTPNDQCSASNLLDHPDDSAYGASGLWIISAIPDTDPRSGAKGYVYIERTSFYEAADLALADAMDVVALAQQPPQVVARDQDDQVACGDATCDGGEDASCPQDCAPFNQSCGDGLCDLWENSINCGPDCGGEDIMQDPGCGDGTCDVGEHELNCVDDCWSGLFAPLVGCLEMSCPVQIGACSDEIPCVDSIVCVAECVGGGGNAATCTDNCKMQIDTTTEQEAFVDMLLACAQQECV